jgi:hypothetical protein
MVKHNLHQDGCWSSLKQSGDTSLLLFSLISPDSGTGLINLFGTIYIVAVIHHVTEKVPANRALRRSPSSRKASCRPPSCHVKDHALIPTAPTNPVDTITFEPHNTLSIHRNRIISPEEHWVDPQIGHNIPAWLAPWIIPENKYLILFYTTMTAFWQADGNCAACVPLDLVQITLTKHEVLGTSETWDLVV